MISHSFESNLRLSLLDATEISSHQFSAKESEKLHDLWKSVKADLGDRKFEFVEPMPEEVQVECSICLGILEEPYKVSCCGYCYCKACIEKVCLNRKPCPLCNAAVFQKIPDKHLERLLQQRNVHCLLKDDGCTWVGEMCKLAEHIQISSSPGPRCQFLPTRCKMCKLLTRRLDKSSHKAVCPNRMVNCDFCQCPCPCPDLYWPCQN